jgi:uncharacterized repeat protein (TIGR03806 family)
MKTSGGYGFLLGILVFFVTPVVAQSHPPRQLSAWALFSISASHVTLRENVTPYRVRTPLFSDHAAKLRTFRLPQGMSLSWRDDGTWSLPVGSVLSKTFYYPRRGGGAGVEEPQDDARRGVLTTIDITRYRVIETRILEHTVDGWMPWVYLWNEQQTEAYYQPEGADIPLELTDRRGFRHRFAYTVPDEGLCVRCHGQDPRGRMLAPIGLVHWQLDVSWNEPEDPPQWAAWPVRGKRPALRKHARPTEADEARYYLAANCGHCHAPQGYAASAALFLTLDSAQLGVCKLARRARGGYGYDITPGRPDESWLLKRMSTVDPILRMPEVGRHLVDDEGVALVRAWIAGMGGDLCAPARLPLIP